MAWKIFVGALGALLAFWLIVSLTTGLFLFGAAKVVGDGAREAISANQQHQAAALQAQTLRAQQRSAALTLNPDEQCIGGTVVRVIGSSYTQVLGAAGRPVACAGRQRLDLAR